MPRITKVTTRRGDEGYTDLADGRRIRKDSRRIQAIGSVDELNSTVGAARALCLRPETAAGLLKIQNDLLCLGAMLSRKSAAPRKAAGPVLNPGRIESLERETAALQERLGPLENFLLPGGTPCAAALHIARAVCRRAERDAVALSHAGPVDPAIRVYLNRLSDVLFQYARMENKAAGTAESLWNSR
jgi:cob(I)alamin adenosyltransferase